MSCLMLLKNVSKCAGNRNEIHSLVGAAFPTGSIKYVSVVGMMAHLKNRGVFQRCRNVYASTSGNTGLAAAEVCHKLGLRFHAVVDARIEPEKLEALYESGATVSKIDGDVRERIRVTREIVSHDPAGVDLDQYGNEGAALGHYQITGPMLWHAMKGRIDAIVVAIGTGGTFGGIAAYLTARKPDIITVPVDSFGSAVIHGKIAKRLITGIGCAFIPANARRAYQFIRSKPYVATDREAFLAARWLLDIEGIGAAVGASGGAVLCAAMDLAKRVEGKTIVCVFHDGAENYRSTIYSDRWMREHGFL